MTQDGAGHARKINLIIKVGICHSTLREGVKENELDLTISHSHSQTLDTEAEGSFTGWQYSAYCHISMSWKHGIS